MNSIVKCPCCKQVMTENQFGKHECEPKYMATKTVFASKIIDLTCKGEKQKLLVVGYDGIEYLVKVQRPMAIPLVLTDSRRKVTDFRTDEDETDPKCIIYKVQYAVLRI